MEMQIFQSCHKVRFAFYWKNNATSQLLPVLFAVTLWCLERGDGLEYLLIGGTGPRPSSQPISAIRE